jgi:hypothetical protein
MQVSIATMTKERKTVGVAQVVDCLLSRHTALISTSSSDKNNNNNKMKRKQKKNMPLPYGLSHIFSSMML